MAPRKNKSLRKAPPSSRRVKFNNKRRKRASSRSGTSNRSSPSLMAVDSLNSQQQSPEGYENIVLYYLSKLRKLFQTQPPAMIGVRRSQSQDTSAMSFNKDQSPGIDGPKSILKVDPDKYARKRSNTKFDSNPECNKRKALNIVAAAIDYGYANNVVSKKGNMFWLRDQKSSVSEKIARREPTPGPQGRRCARCRKCPVRRARSMTVSPSASVFDVDTPSRTTASTVRSKTRSRSRSPRISRRNGKVRKAQTARKSLKRNKSSTDYSASETTLHPSKSSPRLSRSRSLLNDRRNVKQKGRGSKNLRKPSKCKMKRSRSNVRVKCTCSFCRMSKAQPNN